MFDRHKKLQDIARALAYAREIVERERQRLNEYIQGNGVSKDGSDPLENSYRRSLQRAEDDVRGIEMQYFELKRSIDGDVHTG